MLKNIILMELYRALKQKSTWVILVILFITTFTFSFFLLGFNISALFGISQDTMEEAATMDVNAALDKFFKEGGLAQVAAAYERSTNSDSYEEDIEIVGQGMYYDSTACDVFRYNVSTMNELMFLAIFAGLFFGSDYAFGMARNYTLINDKRWKGLAGKAIAMGAYVLIMHIWIWIISAFASTCWAKTFELGITPRFLLYFIASYFLIFAFALIVAAATVICRSRSAGITFGVLFSMGTVSYLVQFADMYLKYKNDNIPQDFSLSHMMITMNLVELRFDSGAWIYTRAFLCAAIYSAAAGFISYLLVKRRDIS
ncbi:MAG: hypothetical protein J6X33_05700 [Clostridiales bacterium]|nr:hypothetical protein [Clostridiales bacterium]